MAAYRAVPARISSSLPWRGYSATPTEKVQARVGQPLEDLLLVEQ